MYRASCFVVVQYFYHRFPEDGTYSKHYTYFSLWIGLIIIGPIISAPQSIKKSLFRNFCECNILLFIVCLDTTVLLICVVIPHIILLTVGFAPILLSDIKSVSKAAVCLHIFLYICFIIIQALEIPLGDVFPLRLLQMILLFFATEIFYLNKRDKCENRPNKKIKKIVLKCSSSTEEEVVETQCSIRVIERTMRVSTEFFLPSVGNSFIYFWTFWGFPLHIFRVGVTGIQRMLFWQQKFFQNTSPAVSCEKVIWKLKRYLQLGTCFQAQ